jgi:MFS family permease
MAFQQVRPFPSPLRRRPFLVYFVARTFSELAYQIAGVAMGWQIYALTHSALYLGLAGLVQFVPTALLVFNAGHAADRYDRAGIVMVCKLIAAMTAALLAWRNLAGAARVSDLFIALGVLGTVIAFEDPAAAALLPGTLPSEELQRGTALSTAAMHAATITGPALGGIAYAASPVVPYTLMAALWLAGGLVLKGIRTGRSGEAQALRGSDLEQSDSGSRSRSRELFAGVAFVRGNPAILGTLSLDLFAVLLGGATALLPIYASDILHAGPWALGVLRSAPAVGALLMTAVLARHTLERRVGLRMFQAVIMFGLMTMVFAISRSIWLSVAALAIMGAADTVSMVIRISLVQLATPDALRGRVSAVNFLFVNASSQLGQFESGLTAAWLGAMPAALLGGIGTVLVALLWMRLFPTLRDVERLEPTNASR